MSFNELNLDNDGLSISWSDGHNSFYPYRYLRGNCCCASCVEEMSGNRRVGESDVREDVEIVDWMQIGKYALQFLWSDTHDTGIYPFDFLKKICRCSSCIN